MVGSLSNFDSRGFRDRTDPACWKGIYPNDSPPPGPPSRLLGDAPLTLRTPLLPH